MKCLRVALCAVLAACAAPAPAPSPPPPAPARDSLDGEYRGTTTRFQADSRRCPRPGLLRLDVLNHAFQFRWDAETWVDATIADDGTVTGGGERISLVGQRRGAQITGDITNGECGLHFTVTKRS
jgi:hypothetical protein